MGAHLAFGCEIERFLEVAPRTDNGEPRTVMPLGTVEKIGRGKSPGGTPISDTLPPRRTMPSACTNALRDTAVMTVPFHAADLF